MELPPAGKYVEPYPLAITNIAVCINFTNPIHPTLTFSAPGKAKQRSALRRSPKQRLPATEKLRQRSAPQRSPDRAPHRPEKQPALPSPHAL